MKKDTIDIAKKKDTVCEFKNSDLPSTTCFLTEQQLKSYREIAANDADSVQKFRISKTHEIKANSEKDMSTQILKKKPWQNGKKVIVLRDSMLRYHSGNKVNAKFYPSATTKDITDHLRSALREKPDLIHADTYDLMNDVNMMKYVRSITKIIEDVTNNGMG